MSEENLIKFLADYLIDNPSMSESDLLSIFSQARKQAILASIPSYKPLDVIDKVKIHKDFEDNREQLNRVRYIDESTEEFE